MSIPPNNLPPNNLPPGGYAPGSYPAPAPKSGGGVLKIVGIGCLGLFLLAAIGGVIAVRSFKSQMAHPSKNSLMGMGVIVGQATMGGEKILLAVVAYHRQHGKYPKTLISLVEEGGVDGKMLHNDLDDTPNPGHVSWRYTKPAEGAPGSTPILEEPYHITMGGGSQPGKIVITLNGRSQAASHGNTGQ